MNINGYALEGELTSQNAGFCRWAYCSKNGRDYHIKEFLSPVYPPEDSPLSERVLKRKREQCESFYKKKRTFYEVLKSCRSGNNVIARDFFREGSHYYLVTERVAASGITPHDVAQRSPARKLALISSLSYSIMLLHACGIVHSDLKPNNLLLKETRNGYLTAKVVDFDGGFFVGDAPEELQGDPIYMAPEALAYSKDKNVPITEKIDIFALGIILHEYWTGERPLFDDRYHYVFEAVAANSMPVLSPNLPPQLEGVIFRMLSRDPLDRPSADEVMLVLRDMDEQINGPRPATKTSHVSETLGREIKPDLENISGGGGDTGGDSPWSVPKLV